MNNMQPMDLMTEQRLARRQAILESARNMIIAEGFDAITIRALAKACRVSVPTLYNQFGGKDQLLAAAIEDHFIGSADLEAYKGSAVGLNRVLAVFEMSTSRLLELPDHHRRLIDALGSLPSSMHVHFRSQQRLTELLLPNLEHMRETGELSRWVMPESLAFQLITAYFSAMLVWASNVIPDSLLRSSVQFSTELLLLGLVSNNLKPHLESRLSSAQKELADFEASYRPRPKPGAKIR